MRNSVASAESRISPAALTNYAESTRIEKSRSGPVAQLGARFHGMEEVTGSIPVRSTNKSNNLADR
jgi:hypothetical protein